MFGNSGRTCEDSRSVKEISVEEMCACMGIVLHFGGTSFEGTATCHLPISVSTLQSLPLFLLRVNEQMRLLPHILAVLRQTSFDAFWRELRFFLLHNLKSNIPKPLSERFRT